MSNFKESQSDLFSVDLELFLANFDNSALDTGLSKLGIHESVAGEQGKNNAYHNVNKVQNQGIYE
jgi:hypothetical protein